MADNISTVASVVIIPESQSNSPPTKRRRSSTADIHSKRPRLSEDVASNSSSTRRESLNATEPSKPTQSDQRTEPSQDRRKSSVQEEKKRGQRLFGGLLSTLSQSTPVGQQKKRHEIEKRQQEKAKLQKAADEARRAEKLANLKEARKEGHVKFIEQAMKTRHSNLLAMANFLFTKTEPKLYYKPWELLPKDEERIKEQIADAKTLIKREVDQFNAQHPSPVHPESGEQQANSILKETVGEPQAESSSVSVPVDTTNAPTEEVAADQAPAEHNAQEEHNGEVIVENEEDTVIY